MELSYLREFVILAETCNFQIAADKLYISQSSLSRHIKAIEDDLGTPLFDRTTRRVSLNEYGLLFLPYARQISNIQLEYTTAFFNRLTQKSETITIGAIPMMAQYNIIDLLMQFKKVNPNFTLNIVEADSLALLEMLKKNKCDFAFIRKPSNLDSSYKVISFGRDSIVAVLPVEHPLATATSLSLDQLKDESFIFLPKDTYMYSLCIKSCQEAGFEPNVAYSGYQGANIIAMVGSGGGVSLLTKKPAQFLATPRVKLIDVVPPIETVISLVHMQNKIMNPAAVHFLNLVKAAGYTAI